MPYIRGERAYCCSGMHVELAYHDEYEINRRCPQLRLAAIRKAEAAQKEAEERRKISMPPPPRYVISGRTYCCSGMHVEVANRGEAEIKRRCPQQP